MAVASCTYRATMIDDAGLDHEPLVEKLPLTVGIYYSEEFTSNIVRAEAGFAGDPPAFWDTYVFDVGECSVLLFDQVVSSMFQEVMHIDSPPGSGTRGLPVAGVFIPSFLSLDVTKGQPGFKQSKTVDINYEITLVERDGRPIDSWQVSGTGVKAHGPTFDRGAHASEAARAAIRDALAEFLVRFDERDKTREHLLKVDYSAEEPRE